MRPSEWISVSLFSSIYSNNVAMLWYSFQSRDHIGNKPYQRGFAYRRKELNAGVNNHPPLATFIWHLKSFLRQTLLH